MNDQYQQNVPTTTSRIFAPMLLAALGGMPASSAAGPATSPVAPMRSSVYFIEGIELTRIAANVPQPAVGITERDFVTKAAAFFNALAASQIDIPADIPTLTDDNLWDLYCD